MHEEDIKNQIEQALEDMNKKFAGKYTISWDKDKFYVTNIPSKEIDKFEDAAPFHNMEACRNFEYGQWCPCRFCRVWCPCMGWWREKRRERDK